MFNVFRFLRRSGRRSKERRAERNVRRRRLTLESLESRQLLTVTLPALADQTVLAGAPLNLALNGSDSLGNAITYSVSVSDSTLTNASQTSAALTTTIPQSNPSLRMSVSYTDPSNSANSFTGDMIFQLFQDLTPNTVNEITSLVNNTSIRGESYFDGLTFHRIIQDFMIQGGDPSGDGTGGPGFKFDDEFNQNLQFTSSGVLALANSGSDTNGSQFFITSGATRYLDFRYTIFGFLTQGDNVRAEIAAVPVQTNTSGETSSPDNPVTITSVTLFTDNQNGVLRLSAPTGTTGTETVIVTATDSATGETSTQSFLVTVQADSTTEPPFLSAIDPIQTSADAAATFSIPSVNASGSTLTYAGSVQTGSSRLSLTVDSSSGQATLTPSSAMPGVYSVTVSVSDGNTSADSQLVPVYLDPLAPTSVQLLSTSGSDGSSNAVTDLDNTAGKTLEFQVNGVLAGSYVQLFSDGTEIGNATATGTTANITTNGTAALTQGAHAITAKQTLQGQAVSVGNLSTTTDLASALSPALALTETSGTKTLTTSLGPASLSGYVYVDADRDGLRTNLQGEAHMGLAGITVRLYLQDTQSNWSEVSGASPVQTSPDGSYSFVDLAAGTYRIQVTPPTNFTDGPAIAGKIGGTAQGTAGQDMLDAITLAAGDSGTEFDFTTLGLLASAISERLFLASTPAWSEILSGLHTAPSTNLAGSTGGPGVSTTFTAGGSAVAIASNATITSSGSPTLASLTATITNRADGASETLSADTSSTTAITATYSNGVLSLTGVADTAAYQTVLKTIKFSDTASAPSTANRTIQVVVNDGTSSSPTATATVVIGGSSLAVPTGYSITADQSSITNTNAASAGFTLTGASIGATYNYTVSSSAGGTAVTGSGTVTSATQDVTGINVSTLPNGTLTFSVTLANTAGTGAAATATATLAQTAPAGYSITADQSSITNTNAASAGFTLTGASIGATYNYTVSSSAGGTAVTGSGTVTSATQDVTGINVSTLPNGTLTFSVTLTNGAGTGAAAPATATLAQSVPSGYTITADQDSVDNANAAAVGFTFAGAEVGATYNYSVASAGGGTPETGTGTVSSATQDVSQINVSLLPNGTLTFSATLNNDAGTGATATAVATLNQTTPAGYSITTDSSTFTNATADSAGFTFAGATLGAMYNYTVSSDGGGTPVTGSGTVTSATLDVTGINISTLSSGTLTFQVTLTNGAGTGSAATTTATLLRDVPSGYTVTADHSQLTAGNAAATGFTLHDAAVGASYNYAVSSSGGGLPLTGSGVIASATQDVTGIDVSGLTNGVLTYQVTLTNAAGTGSAASATATLTLTVPSGYTIAANQATITTTEATATGFTFTGAEIGATYTVIVTSSAGGTAVTSGGTVTATNQQVTGINVSTLPNGTLTYSVTLINSLGAGSAATATATLDQQLPSGYSITANDSLIVLENGAVTSFTMSGAEVGTTYNYTVASSGGGAAVTGSGTVSSATQEVTGIDVSALPAGTLTISLTLTNSLGVGAVANATATLA